MIEQADPGHGMVGKRSSSSLRTWLVVIVAITIGVIATVVHVRGGDGIVIGTGDGVFGAVSAQPPARYYPNPRRILPPPADTAGSGGYSVLFAHDGKLVRWDPCQVIHYVVRPTGQIAGGSVALQRAVDELSNDTGLLFIDDGATAEAPSPSRAAYQPDRYGQIWAPVLISWSNAVEYPQLAGDVVGMAGPVATRGKNARLVSGEVVFDAVDLARIASQPDGVAMVRDVMLHELGHLVGLGHVDDPTQIMNPVAVQPLGGYGAGDRRGLSVLGDGHCFTKG
jgi:hypothetical protein